MGCDIHLVVERRIAPDKWVAVNTMNGHHRSPWHVKDGDYSWSSPAARERNYERFAKLAGVRGRGPDARGAPEDASETTRHLIDGWSTDGHSHSWLPITEATPIFVETASKLSDHDRKSPVAYFFGIEEEEAAEHRIVFWFDN